MDCSMPGFPVRHQLPELAQTHVHQVGDAIQPSHPLLSPSPPAFYIYINIYKMKVTQSCQTLWSRGLYSPWNSQARILECVASPFSRGSSQPRDWTQVSCIAGGFFTSWATKETKEYQSGLPILSAVDLPNPGMNRGLLHCMWILYQVSYLSICLWASLIAQLDKHLLNEYMSEGMNKHFLVAWYEKYKEEEGMR